MSLCAGRIANKGIVRSHPLFRHFEYAVSGDHIRRMIGLENPFTVCTDRRQEFARKFHLSEEVVEDRLRVRPHVRSRHRIRELEEGFAAESSISSGSE